MYWCGFVIADSKERSAKKLRHTLKQYYAH